MADRPRIPGRTTTAKEVPLGCPVGRLPQTFRILKIREDF